MPLAWADMRDILATNFQANPLPVEGGGTGSGSVEGALANLGIVDYIVAQGQSGDWYYTKYASGQAECWSYVTLSISGFKAWGGIYESSQNIAPKSYPFTWWSVPGFTALFRNGGSGMFIAGFEYGSTGSTTQSPQVNVLRGGNWTNSSVANVLLYATGRWK